ncbi:MAG: hypothetical protein ACYS8X_03630 [Planctomycetota bacterium]|jgi:hypothetical protein
MTTDFRTSSPSTKRVVRNVVLLAVLIASLLAAWTYIVSIKGAARRRGAEIVAEIRQRGLSALAPPEPIRWYLRQVQAVQGPARSGWRAVVTGVDEGGLHNGFDVRVSRTLTGRAGTWERWSLDEHATHSRYWAGKVTIEGNTVSAALTTTIDFKDGRVAAVQYLGGQRCHSQSPAPDNYLPEGCLDIATVLMLGRNKPIQFNLILNELGPTDQAIRFSTCGMRKARQLLPLNTDAVDAVQISYPDIRHDAFQVAFLDGEGRLIEVKSRGVTETLVPEAMRQQFPVADEQLLREIFKAAHNAPWPDEAADAPATDDAE